MTQQGCDVVLQSSSFTVPQRCASCGAPPQTTRTTKKSKKQGSWTTTRSFQIPYCGPCAARAQATWVKGIGLAAATFGIVLVLAAIGFVAPGLPAALLIGLPIVLSLGFAIVAMTAFAPKPPPLPAMATGDAVRLVKFNGNTSTLHCVNPHWAEELARANGIQPLPKNRSPFFASGSLWIAILGAPLAAIGIWVIGHPQVHIDNASEDAVQVWLDGKQSIVVQPNASGAAPPSIWVAHGKHTYGRSKVGATSPASTVDADTTINDAHLYNPGKTACYWLVADSYGSSSVMGMQRGPQPIQEFYSFDKVNTWFGDNPQSIEVSNGERGGTRVALQRAKMCMDLAEHGCSDTDREAFVVCERAATNEEALDKCAKAVTCGTAKPSVASSKAPAGPAAHAGGHAASAPPAHAAPHPSAAPPKAK